MKKILKSKEFTQRYPYCSNCRNLLGLDRLLTPEEAETIRSCDCLSKARGRR